MQQTKGYTGSGPGPFNPVRNGPAPRDALHLCLVGPEKSLAVAGQALNRRVEMGPYLTGEANPAEAKYGPAPTVAELKAAGRTAPGRSRPLKLSGRLFYGRGGPWVGFFYWEKGRSGALGRRQEPARTKTGAESVLTCGRVAAAPIRCAPISGGKFFRFTR